MQQYSKRMRGLFRQLGATAYERELSGLMSKLESDFRRWRGGEIDAIELAHRVNEFARGRTKRDLDYKYEPSQILPMMVAQAIVRGILRENEVPPEVVEALDEHIEYFKRGIADGSISFEDED